MDKKYLVWMNCYGAWAPDLRSLIETKGYDEYLSSVVEKVSSISSQIEAFYISGGMLDKLGRSECQTTKPELAKRFRNHGINLKIEIDEESITSQSIMKKFLMTWSEKFSDCQPIIFVDEVRFPTNKFTFQYFCEKLNISLDPDGVIIPIKRLDDHPNSTPKVQGEKLALMKELGVEAVDEAEKLIRKSHSNKQAS